MSQTLTLNVDDVDTQITNLGAGARIELQRDTTSAFAAPTSLSNITLVAGQSQYRPFDAAGDSSSWYRFRLTTSTGTNPSAWTTYQAGAPTAYASVADLRERVQVPNNSRDNLLSDLLVAVTVRITQELGFDFFRHPAVSGTEVVLYDGRAGNTITDLQGFVSVTGIRMASYTGSTLVSLTSGNWFLRNPVRPGGPYLDLVLSDVGTYTYYYVGYGTVEFTGVRGYASIPSDIEEATLQWAADLYRIGSAGGSPLGATGLGATEGGGPTFIGGMPRFAWETVESYKKRHALWLVA